MKPWKAAWIWWLTSYLASAVIGFYVGQYLDRPRQEREIAQYTIATMLPRCPVKDSKELETRVAAYLGALKRTRPDGRGVPVWREDCTIGVDLGITITERIRLKGWAWEQ